MSAVIVVGYVLVRNYLYVDAGMLRPNFAQIHKAYDFNLWELPMTLFGFAAVFAGLAATWRGQRKGLVWIALLYAFVAVDLLGLRYYVTSVEPERLVVHHVRLETPKLTKPLRLLHISDIQSGEITDYEVKVFAEIKALKPDLVLNTGDLLQVVPPATFEAEFSKLLELIKEVNPRLGTFAVYGDTERELYRYSPEQLAPLRILSSRSAQIDTGGGVIDLHGLSLYQSKNELWATRTVEDWLAQTNSDDFRILLGHAPDYALNVVDLPVDLCLAGHTHGGQVRVPWHGPLVIDSEVPKEWSRGFRRIGIPYLNVSAGAGSNRFEGLPPLRFNCPTEMTLIELVPMRSIR
ncbi:MULTISPECIES: metallophosphoesterase [unclassified Lentimonas]|nr:MULTISPECIES: metallophosphoesterase [unclassified Lentimonas]